MAVSGLKALLDFFGFQPIGRQKLESENEDNFLHVQYITIMVNLTISLNKHGTLVTRISFKL